MNISPIDSPSQTSIQPDRKNASKEWSLTICGDWAPWDDHLRVLQTAPKEFYGDLLPVLRDSDLAVLNLEGVLGDDTLEPILKDGISIRIPLDVVPGLKAVPFQLACLANNHIFDYGPQGLQSTLAALKTGGLASIGAGMTVEDAEAPAIFQFGDTRVAILNVAEGEEALSVDSNPGAAPFDLSRIKTHLAALQAEVDVRVVIVHAGREHLAVPAPYIRDFYRSLVDGGANLVIGHHPHVPQGIETYRGVPIAYSLGNFALYMASSFPYHTLGYCVKARFYGSALQKFEIWPYQIERDRLHLLNGEARTAFMTQLDELSQLITENGRLNDIWNAFADHWFISSGIEELTANTLAFSTQAFRWEIMLKETVSRYQGKSVKDRLARKILWPSIHRLERRTARKMIDDPIRIQKAAAILRNRFDTPAHRELFLTVLDRIMHKQFGDSPAWAKNLLAKIYESY